MRYSTNAAIGLAEPRRFRFSKPKKQASPRLATGPTTDTQNSSLALRDSPSICEKPPRKNSVMLSTRRPRRIASREWLNS